ncbi:response regulator transcription factor [Micromonospora sp. STR1s_6]|uniref:Response regulator transcription factor n=2 Tax=Micromonospora tarensis TaxID=2806100 RepID=A0ABS1YN31_9ACTN|nr:response regulator transcription factor [Micromonospora tarensis]
MQERMEAEFEGRVVVEVMRRVRTALGAPSSLVLYADTPVASRSLVSLARRFGVLNNVRAVFNEAGALEAVRALPRATVLIDASGDLNVGELVRGIKDVDQECVVIVLGVKSTGDARAAVQSGAKGVIRHGWYSELELSARLLVSLMNDKSSAERPMLTVGVPAPPGRSSVLNPGHASLSEREVRVLIGLSQGKGNAEIARDLWISDETIKTHVRRIFKKLGARDRAHAVALAYQNGYFK